MDKPSSMSELPPNTPMGPSQTLIVKAVDPNWQFTDFSLLANRVYEVIAKGDWGVIDPPKRGLTGPGGNGQPAGGTFVYPGASQGALLMRFQNAQQSSQGLFVFANDASRQDGIWSLPLGIQTTGDYVAGILSFLANDETLVAKPDAFRDNTGSLQVTVTDKGPAT